MQGSGQNENTILKQYRQNFKHKRIQLLRHQCRLEFLDRILCTLGSKKEATYISTKLQKQKGIIPQGDILLLVFLFMLKFLKLLLLS